MIFGSKERFAIEIEPVFPSWETRFRQEAAAWAGLSVWVSGLNICRHVPVGSDRVEDRVYVPLGPIADWIVKKWPWIAYEERPSLFPLGADPRRSFRQWLDREPPEGLTLEEWYEHRRLWWSRHFLEANAQGAVLPDLAFVRDGEDLVIGWSGVHAEGERRSDSGTLRIRWHEAISVFSGFVLEVAGAFQEAGESSCFSWLKDPEPLSISAGTGRRLLAYYVGRGEEKLRSDLGTSGEDDLWELLGIESDDPAASVVTQVLRDLPPGAGPDLVGKALDIQRDICNRVGSKGRDELRLLGGEVLQAVSRPEDQGHEAALALRVSHGLDGEPISTETLEEIVADCGIEMEDVEEEFVSAGEDVSSILGAGENKGARIAFFRTPRMSRPWARRFELSRMIGTVMLDPLRGGYLGRASSSWTSSMLRRRSGAFAAELLLPVAGLRKMDLWALDSPARPTVFQSILNNYRIGARAAAFQIWNLGLLSSAELRDELIEEFADVGGDE